MAQTVKNLPVMQENWVRSLGREDPLDKEMGTSENLMINFFDPRDDREDFKAMVHKLGFIFFNF